MKCSTYQPTYLTHEKGRLRGDGAIPQEKIAIYDSIAYEKLCINSSVIGIQPFVKPAN